MDGDSFLFPVLAFPQRTGLVLTKRPVISRSRGNNNNNRKTMAGSQEQFDITPQAAFAVQLARH